MRPVFICLYFYWKKNCQKGKKRRKCFAMSKKSINFAHIKFNFLIKKSDYQNINNYISTYCFVENEEMAH